MSLVYVDPNLWEVIWPGFTRIPEFDQPYITPSEKPRKILQYFPQGDSPHLGPGPGFLHMQGMMGEQQG
jgi:hypothetical protein